MLMNVHMSSSFPVSMHQDHRMFSISSPPQVKIMTVAPSSDIVHAYLCHESLAEPSVTYLPARGWEIPHSPRFIFFLLEVPGTVRFE